MSEADEITKLTERLENIFAWKSLFYCKKE
jgi:hypothetical protein